MNRLQIEVLVQDLTEVKGAMARMKAAAVDADSDASASRGVCCSGCLGLWLIVSGVWQ